MFEGLLQPVHLIIILAIVLLIFGPAKLGNLGGALGKSIREFKQATKEAAPSGEKEVEAPAQVNSEEARVS